MSNDDSTSVGISADLSVKYAGALVIGAILALVALRVVLDKKG